MNTSRFRDEPGNARLWDHKHQSCSHCLRFNWHQTHHWRKTRSLGCMWCPLYIWIFRRMPTFHISCELFPHRQMIWFQWMDATCLDLLLALDLACCLEGFGMGITSATEILDLWHVCRLASTKSTFQSHRHTQLWSRQFFNTGYRWATTWTRFIATRIWIGKQDDGPSSSYSRICDDSLYQECRGQHPDQQTFRDGSIKKVILFMSSLEFTAKIETGWHDDADCPIGHTRQSAARQFVDKFSHCWACDLICFMCSFSEAIVSKLKS